MKEVKERDKRLCVPEDFEFNGWSKANNYGLRREDFADAKEWARTRYGRAVKVSAAWRKTDEARKATAIVMAEKWEERVAKAKRASDTTEVLLLEKLTTHEDGMATSELVAGCINIIARELAKRGVRDVEQLELKDLILISNNLLALTKAAAAVKKDMDWKPNTVVVPVVQSSSKTGGVVGGLKDVIDIRATK